MTLESNESLWYKKIRDCKTEKNKNYDSSRQEKKDDKISKTSRILPTLLSCRGPFAIPNKGLEAR